MPEPVRTVLDLGVIDALSRRAIIGDRRAMRDVDPALLSERKEDRAGRCYELSLAWMWAHRDHPNLDQVRLCHGSIEGLGNPRIAHAWITLPMPRERDGRIVRHAHCLASLIVVPETVWTRRARAVALRSYDLLQVLQHVDDKNTSGPWHSRPFGWDDCPHGLTPVGGDGPDRFCPHGCTPQTLHDEAQPDGTIRHIL